MVKNKLRDLSEIFSPSAPVTSRQSFHGRYNQLKKIENAIYEKGQHIILYGERGVGKTSIANMAEKIDEELITSKYTCSKHSQYQDIWENVFKEIRLNIQFSDEATLNNKSELLKMVDSILTTEIDSSAILYLFKKIEKRIFIILDEFDIIEDIDTTSLFANTIKALSDNVPNTTLMIVGIAENISDLIGEHLSLERCISQVQVPRMNQTELKEVIDNGLAKLKMHMDTSVKEDIIHFSQGFPHYVHLMAKYTVESALFYHYTSILRKNFDEAVEKAVENAYESIRVTYQKAIHTNKVNSFFENVVYSCAMVKEDNYGTFRASDLIEPISKLLKQDVKLSRFIYHLSRLDRKERGPLLQKIKTDNQTRYRFDNPILKAYILLLLYRKGINNKKTSSWSNNKT